MEISNSGVDRLERAPAALARVSLTNMRLTKKCRRLWLLVGLLIAVIVLLVIGIVVAFLTGGSGDVVIGGLPGAYPGIRSPTDTYLSDARTAPLRSLDAR